MKRALFALMLVVSMVRFGGAADAKDDLQPIFNGKDLSGWKDGDNHKFWKVVDGVLVGENDEAKKGNMLYTEKSYGDVVVEAECRWSGEIDSGIMLRKPEIQLQIGTSRSLKRDMTCSFYAHGKYPDPARAQGVDKLLKVGEWNLIRFEAKGSKFTAWLNGEKVVEYEDPAFPNAAPIGLQIHPGLKMKVEFRNIKAKALN